MYRYEESGLVEENRLVAPCRGDKHRQPVSRVSRLVEKRFGNAGKQTERAQDMERRYV